MNQKKGKHQDVVDPFCLAHRSFQLDFNTFRIKPNLDLDAPNQSRLQATIDRLELNIDNDYVEERIEVIKNYCLGRASMSQLQMYYPFIATEMQAQNFDKVYLPRMKAFFVANP